MNPELRQKLHFSRPTTAVVPATVTNPPASGGIFNFHDEQYQLSYDNADAAHATLCTIETAIDKLILTQESQVTPGMFGVASNLNLLVYADTVIIRGPLSLPGKNVSIFARVIGSEPDAQNRDAKIDVSGAVAASAPPNLAKASQAAEGADKDCDGEGCPGADGGSGTAGSAGPNGSDGGKIELYVGSFQSGAHLSLVANGSNGARGQDGQPGQDGGNGGAGQGELASRGGFRRGRRGGNGGHGGTGGAGGAGGDAGSGGLIVAFSLLAPSNLTLLTSANGGTSGAGGNGGDGGNGGKGGPNGLHAEDSSHDGNAGDGGTAGMFGFPGNGGSIGVSTAVYNAHITPPVPSNQEDWVPFGEIPPGLPGQVGLPGAPGTQGGPGVRGGLPTSQRQRILITGESVVRGITDADLAFCASVAQCSMALQKAKLLYAMADPEATETPSAYDRAALLLVWLRTITAAFTTTQPSRSPGAQTPAPMSETLSQTDRDLLQSVNSQAAALAARLTLRRDFFGNLPSYVPQGSLSFYQGLLTTILGTTGTFKQIEDNYKDYFGAGDAQKMTLRQLGVAKDQAKSQGSTLRTQQTDALTNANAMAATITADQTAVENQYPIMKQAIRNVEHDLGGLAAAGCVFDSVVKAMGNIATQSKDKDAKIAAKIAVPVNQGLQLGLAKGLGLDALPTANLVQKVDVYGDSIQSLTESYTISQGVITESDPNAYKLLVEEKAFDDILKPYLSLPSAKAAKEALQQYVTLVLKRNADILKYNAYLADLASLKGQLAQNAAQLNQVETAIAQSSNPALAPLVAFMARLYNDARAQVIHTIYMASRSFAFWSLNPKYSAFSSIVGLSDPTGINNGTLNALLQNILIDLGQAIESFGTGPQEFPAQNTGAQNQTPPATSPGTVPSETPPLGVAFTLTASDNPGLFETFKTPNSDGLYQVSFVIPPAFKRTSEDENPFYGKANVRLSKVRPWVKGATNRDGVLHVEITHNGAETIVGTNNVANSFTHEHIKKSFRFDYSKLYQSSAIALDGDFESKGSQNLYAQPGPFTTWTLTVDRKDNTGLNMSAVDTIKVEFWGNSYVFD